MKGMCHLSIKMIIILQNRAELCSVHRTSHESFFVTVCMEQCVEFSLYKQITNGNESEFNREHNIRKRHNRFNAEEVLLKLLMFTCKNICHVYLTTKQHSKLFNIGNTPERWASCTTELSLSLSHYTHKLNFKHFACRQTNEHARMHISSVDRILFEVSFAVDHTIRTSHTEHTMGAVDRF